MFGFWLFVGICVRFEYMTCILAFSLSLQPTSHYKHMGERSHKQTSKKATINGGVGARRGGASDYKGEGANGEGVLSMPFEHCRMVNATANTYIYNAYDKKTIAWRRIPPYC